MSVLTTADYADQYVRFLSKELLPHAVNTLVLDQLCDTKPLPRKVGSTGIRFYRKRVADAGNVSQLQENVSLSDFVTLTYDKVDADLVPWGQAYRYSDILGWTALLDHEQQIIETAGEEAALHYDKLIRNVAIATTPNGLTESYPIAYSAANQTFAYLAATGTQANGKLTVADILFNMVKLRVAKARPFEGGYFIGAIPAESTNEILSDSTYVNVKSYGDSGKKDLYRGEMDRLLGVRLLWQTNPMREGGTQGAYSEAGTAGGGVIYDSLFCGKGSLGAVMLEGGKPRSPRIMISRGPQKSDVLDQFTTVGWKAYFTTVMLNAAFGRVHRHKSLIA